MKVSNRSWAPWFAEMVEKRQTDRQIAEARRREREYWERVVVAIDDRQPQPGAFDGAWFRSVCRAAFGPRKTP